MNEPLVLDDFGLPGNHIQEVCANAVARAQQEGRPVQFNFNDQVLLANPDTNPKELAKHYSDECDRLHREWIASPEYKAQQEAAEQAALQKAESLRRALAHCPESFTLRDAAGWKAAYDANKDGYGGAIMSYAQQWGRLMEGRIASGESLESIAQETSHQADTDGLTGFMYGCAVAILSKVWIHGEALRRWHNLNTQLHNEGEKANASGGVLNPALLTFKEP